MLAMKNAAYSIVLFASIAAAFVAGSWSRERTTADAAAPRASKILYYVDPMHPGYKSDKPGIAPDCGMQLEPVYDNGPAQAAPPPAGALGISRQKQQLLGIRVSPVEEQSGAREVRMFGRVAAEETRVYRINVGVDGVIRQLSDATTGSHVEADQWLATFSSPETRQPIQAYLVSLDVVDRAEKAGDNSTQLGLARAGEQVAIDRLLTIGMSAVQLAEIRHARQVPPNIKVTATAAGFIVARNVSTGQKIEKGTELYRIADLSKVWIHASAFGLEGDDVRPGMEATVVLPGRNRSFHARVSDVLPQFDSAAQSLQIRLEADNPASVLRPDMFVDVEMHIPAAPAITVPSDSIVDTGRRKIVYVQSGDALFEPREVETGWQSGGRVAIGKGLRPGERIAVSGTFLLDSERRMRLTAADTGAEP
jgi:Cu(I)/Ag(I) efflux system membrane fusion protein